MGVYLGGCLFPVLMTSVSDCFMRQPEPLVWLWKHTVMATALALNEWLLPSDALFRLPGSHSGAPRYFLLFSALAVPHLDGASLRGPQRSSVPYSGWSLPWPPCLNITLPLILLIFGFIYIPLLFDAILIYIISIFILVYLPSSVFPVGSQTWIGIGVTWRL